jgi:hypothetical protein
VRRIDAWTVLAGTAIAVLTTVCGAWRWALVSRGMGIELPLRNAVAECYRSQFLNVTFPGGVVGDVRRGVGHGRGVGEVGRGLRSVLWERTAGQVVLAAVTVGALLILPSPLRSAGGAEAAVPSAISRGGQGLGTASESHSLATVSTVVLVGCLLGLVAAAVALPWRWRSSALALPSRVGSTVVRDVRAGLLGRHTWPGVVAASAVVVTGHVATFVVVARGAGVTASAARLVPLALLVLMAMALPLNVAGWGPREGAAAWAFGAAGLGAADGVATAVAYGVVSLVASLPGAALLVLSRRRAALPAAAVGTEVARA